MPPQPQSVTLLALYGGQKLYCKDCWYFIREIWRDNTLCNSLYSLEMTLIDAIGKHTDRLGLLFGLKGHLKKGQLFLINAQTCMHFSEVYGRTQCLIRRLVYIIG